ncbi:MAG: trehalose-phosphatase [Deltaproteobacteria bacterium]|nr:MAG: trehalose-phosphatase [Deltaproteobacteria bacterium]
MEHLFRKWDVIQERIRQARKVYLFFDYDGTLTPIVSRPELALCPPEVRKDLVQLRDSPGVFVAIISGRSLEDLYGLIGVPGITYVGNHGLEIRNPAGIHKKNLSVGRQKEKTVIANSLKKILGNLPGILFEDKESILAVHFRLVPKSHHEKIFQEMEAFTRQWGENWRVTRGKRVFEIQPRVDFHKGKAIRDLLKDVSAPGLLPFYFGDDQSDEAAFRFLRGKGVTVFIGPPDMPSAGEFFLEDPAEVAEFLKRLIKVLPEGDSAAAKT